MDKKAFENIARKGENAGYSIFSFSHKAVYCIKDINHHHFNYF